MPLKLPAPAPRTQDQAPAPEKTGPVRKFLHTLPPLRLPRPALHWPGGTHGAALLWQGAAAVLALVLGAGQVYGGAAPFGLAMALGCAPGYLLPAVVGAMAGGLLFQPALLAAQLIGALLASLAARRLFAGRYWPAALAASTVLLAGQALAGFRFGLSAAQYAQALGTALLAAGFGFAIHALPARSARGACLWLAMLVACLQRLPVWGFAPGLLAAALAGLCAAYAGTLEQSAVLSIALAAAFTAASPTQSYAALAVALGTLAAACLCPGERVRGAGVFLAGCALGALAAPGAAAALPLLFGCGLAVVVFLLLPESVLHTLFPVGVTALPRQSPAMNAAARRLSGVADALAEVAETVTAVCERQAAGRSETFDFVVDYTARRLCSHCTRREGCWLHGYSATVDGLYHLKPFLEQNGRAELENFPGQLSACIHPADLCAAVTHGYRLWRSRRQRRAQMAVLRTALCEQYAAVAGALSQLADKLGQTGLPDPRREARAAQLFASLGLEALECSVTTDLSGRMTVNVTVARTSFTPDELAALTLELGRICRRALASPDISHCRTVTTLTFAEKPAYRAVFGAANLPAAGQEVSGDAWDQFSDGSGRAQMLLCDGMGAGRAAAVDGQMAARLTAQLLKAGFAAESAARLVNVALGLKSTDAESGATLDLLTVDLYSGRAGLFKAGAAPSYLVRGGIPRAIEGASLPIGMVDSVVGRSTALTLDEGDLLVMLSDGALADGGEWLAQQLTLCARLGHSPAEVAQTVAEAAARRVSAHRDDITVTVLRLEKA